MNLIAKSEAKSLFSFFAMVGKFFFLTIFSVVLFFALGALIVLFCQMYFLEIGNPERDLAYGLFLNPLNLFAFIVFLLAVFLFSVWELKRMFFR